MHVNRPATKIAVSWYHTCAIRTGCDVQCIDKNAKCFKGKFRYCVCGRMLGAFVRNAPALALVCERGSVLLYTMYRPKCKILAGQILKKNVH